MAERAVVLAIDDDTLILNTVVTTLKGEFSVRPFTSGEGALQYLQTGSADLILLDHHMPGKSGLDVLRELQANPKTSPIPVVFLTGSENDEGEIRALERGAADYILKPVRPRLLLTRVRLQVELLQHRRCLMKLVEEKTRRLNAAIDKLKLREDITLGLLARVTDLRDHDTGDHLYRTTETVRIITRDLIDCGVPGYNLTAYEAEDIVRSTRLHDLGKIAMPDHVLQKPGRLTPDEFDIIRMHPVHGERLLNEFILQMDDSFLNAARDIAYCHHEWWDGTGYPQGLSGTGIPLSARVVAIADVYDALTSARPYKSAYSHQQSVEIIRSNSGTHFDPYVAEIFLRHAEEIARVRLSAQATASVT